MNIRIGEVIKQLRNKNKYTQKALACYLGVTEQAISRWESETGYPDIELLPMIADFFDVTIDDLLEALRQKDVFDISQVQYAIVETNGQMSVLLKPEYEPVVRKDLKINPQQTKLQCLVVADGQVITQDFDICKTDEKKLSKLLEKNKVKLNDIMLMTIDKNGNKNIVKKDNK